MQALVFIINLPFTFLGIFPLVLSFPYSFELHRSPIAVIFKVKSFWWGFNLYKNARAMTVGYIILIGPKVLKNDLEHELIHVRQCNQYPFVYPFLYFYETLKYGYRKNKFEEEAYRLSKSVYKSSNH